MKLEMYLYYIICPEISPRPGLYTLVLYIECHRYTYIIELHTILTWNWKCIYYITCPTVWEIKNFNLHVHFSSIYDYDMLYQFAMIINRSVHQIYKMHWKCIIILNRLKVIWHEIYENIAMHANWSIYNFHDNELHPRASQNIIYTCTCGMKYISCWCHSTYACMSTWIFN